MDSTTIAVIISVVYVLTKIVEKLVCVIVDKISPKKCILSPEDKLEIKEHCNVLAKDCGLSRSEEEALFQIKDYTRELKEMHNKYDEDGTPIWYFPKSSEKTQDKMLESLNKISNSQDQISRILVGVLEKLDK